MPATILPWVVRLPRTSSATSEAVILPALSRNLASLSATAVASLGVRGAPLGSPCMSLAPATLELRPQRDHVDVVADAGDDRGLQSQRDGRRQDDLSIGVDRDARQYRLVDQLDGGHGGVSPCGRRD